MPANDPTVKVLVLTAAEPLDHAAGKRAAGG
jgi:hypothetical protein